MRQEKHHRITRANLRNLIRLLSYLSVILFNVNNIEITVAFFVLGAGCVIHFITKGVLIRNVVMCNNGIYGVVRHPYYMANYLIDVSFCLLSGNLYLVLIYPFIFFWAYGPTLRKEERYLAATHNEPYIEYMLDVPQVFPDSYFTKYLQGIFSGFSKKRVSRNEISRIFRFWATAFFICFLHTLKSVNLHSIFNLSNSNSFAFMLLVVILYITSLFIRGKR
jgi:protein-S-isoprenylcysteine O-methyltransferase Ste14